MCTVIVAITIVKLATVQLPTKLKEIQFWRHLSAPFPCICTWVEQQWHFVKVHKDDPLFRSTRIQSMDSDEILSWSSISGSIMTRIVNILQSIKVVLFWSGQRNDWFNQFAWVSFGCFGNLLLNLHHIVRLVNLAIRGEVTLLCPMLKIGRRKTLFFFKTLT